jgi:hypothetical protein
MPEETRRRLAEDSPESAADFIRRSAEAVRARGEGVGTQRAQRLALIEWARGNGRALAFSHIEQFIRVSEGAEHVVFHDPQRGVAVKATHVNRFGHSVIAEGASASPLEYIQRLEFQNTLFGDEIRIEGVAFDEAQIEIITTQPWIVASPEHPSPTQAEIDVYFSSLGFLKAELVADVPLYFHRDLGILVADAHDRNILRNESGALVPIDLVIGRPGSDLLRRITEQLDTTLP